MIKSTLQSWVGAWKELKQWVFPASTEVPSGAQRGAFWIDDVPKWYDGTTERNFGVSEHNALSSIDGGDPAIPYFGHNTQLMQSRQVNAGAANGFLVLDSLGYVPMANVPISLLGAMRYQTTWDASSNTPTLPSLPDQTTKGYYWKVSVAGTYSGHTYSVGDFIISNGTSWDWCDNVDSITSVFGRTGNVTAQAGDYTAAQVTNTPSGNISATTVQAALNELDSEKLDLTTASSTYATKTTTAKLTLGTCTTAQSTVAKVVTLANYVLTQGDIIEVLFTYASVSGATLNVNGTGAKAIYDSGAVTSTSSWSAGQLVGLMYDGAYWHILWVKNPSDTGNIIDRTLAARVSIKDHSTNNANYSLTWDNGSGTLFKTVSKLYFNPSTGLLQATKVGVIGGTSDGFMKADGTVDSTTYAPLSSVPAVDSVPTDGSSNAVSSNGVYDAIANISSSTPYPAYAGTESGAGAYNMFRFEWPVNTGYTYDTTVVEITTYASDHPTDMGIMQIQLSVSYEGGTFEYRAEEIWATPEMAGRGRIAFYDNAPTSKNVYIGVYMESTGRNSAGRVVSSVSPSLRTVVYYANSEMMGGESAINTGVHTLKLLSKGSNSFINAYLSCPITDTEGNWGVVSLKNANTTNALELLTSADGRAIVQSYDRDNALYNPMVIAGTYVQIDSTGFIRMANQGYVPMLRFDPAYQGGLNGYIEYRDNGDGTPRPLFVEAASFNLEYGGMPVTVTTVATSDDSKKVANTEWVKDVCPQLSTGFSAGTTHVYRSYSDTKSANIVYFEY